MKFAYYSGCRESVLRRDYKSLADFLHKNGYSAVELLENAFSDKPLFTSLKEAEDFRAYMSSRDIKIACYSVYADVYLNIDGIVDYLKEQIDIAVSLGSPYFHHTIRIPLTLSENDLSYEEMTNTVFPRLCEIIRYAARRGIEVLYEPQGMYYNGFGLLNLVEKLRGEDGCENVGICFDCGNPAFVDCAPYELLQKTIPYVKHVHLKDYKYIFEQNCKGANSTACGRNICEVPVGDGDMRILDCVKLLEDSGYNGYYSTEVNPGAPDITTDDAGVMAIRALRDLTKGFFE